MPQLDLVGVPEDVCARASDLDLEIAAWDETKGAVRRHGLVFVGTHAEIRAYLQAWEHCRAVSLADQAIAGPRRIRRSVLALRALRSGDLVGQRDGRKVVVTSGMLYTPFRGDRLAIPDDLAGHVDILGIRVGNRFQHSAPQDIPGEAYAMRIHQAARLALAASTRSSLVSIELSDPAEAAFGREMHLDTCQAHMEISMEVQLRPGSPLVEFVAIVLGDSL